MQRPLYLFFILLLTSLPFLTAWIPAFPKRVSLSSSRIYSSSEEWKGAVVSNAANGKINGCLITAVGEDPVTEWVIEIDGKEADLGRFSEAIYKKIISDAKSQRFQGFRPGTIPPHLEPTYRAFAMDECARETVLEAMQQNNIRPFESARSDFEWENFCIPPPIKKKNKKRKKTASSEAATAEPAAVKEPQWLTFENMKEAIDAGWKPGQSFSFVAKKVKGQKVKGETETSGATPLGLNY